MSGVYTQKKYSRSVERLWWKEGSPQLATASINVSRFAPKDCVVRMHNNIIIQFQLEPSIAKKVCTHLGMNYEIRCSPNSP